MCGIAGFVETAIDEQEADARLRRMLARIAHRGPDGEGVHVGNGVAMGMRRLSIIDLEGGTQPIWNEDGQVCVVFNGEIYNFVELRAELMAKGHVFRTASDTEVLVHLYEEAGEAMLDRLRGMFGFAIFDRRARSLFIARDHFGQKPLYYTSAEGRFAFGSEMKSLFCLPWVRREEDPDAFFDYAAWLSLPPPRTHFRHIHKLEAGSSIRVPLDAPHRAQPRKYWRYELAVQPDLTDPDAAAAELERVLSESVHIHLRADVPLGVLLSSGLDSRTVVSFAQQHTHGAMQTFTIGFGTGDSEQAGAAETAREIGSRHHQLEVGPRDIAEDIPRVAALLDEPVGDPACFAVRRICKFARDHVKVLLSGEGSDELFGGYGRYPWMLATLEKTDNLRWLRHVLPKPRFSSGSRWERLLQRIHATRAAETLLNRREGFPGDTAHPRGFTPAQLAANHARAEQIGASLVRPQRDGLSTLLTLDLDWQLAESLLQKADKMSMGASIELRTPILDIEVARLAARIPSTLKLAPGGPGKYILRRMLGRRIKEDMMRPKKGFPVPFEQWFAGPLREQVEAEIFAGDSPVLARLEKPLLRRAWDDFLSGQFDGKYHFYALWLYAHWRRAITAV